MNRLDRLQGLQKKHVSNPLSWQYPTGYSDEMPTTNFIVFIFTGIHGIGIAHGLHHLKGSCNQTKDTL